MVTTDEFETSFIHLPTSHSSPRLQYSSSMAPPVDALQSFIHLTDNIPRWLTKLDDLVAKCETQFERFTRITRQGEVKLTRKKKNKSTESLRPAKDEDIAITLQNPQGGANTTSCAPALRSTTEIPTAFNDSPHRKTPRKRRAGSDLSGEFSSHCRYRTKNMVVVYYDSEIQAAFEDLVRGIALARSTLRKGKNAASFNARLTSIGMRPPPIAKTIDRPGEFSLDQKATLKPNDSRTSMGYSEMDSMKCYEEMDRDLEHAQNQCERAAHQFLRDGDCTAEMEETKRRFVNCQEVAKQEAEKLRIQKAGEDAGQKENEELEEAKTLVGESTPPNRETEDKATEIDVAPKTNPPSLTQMNFVGTGVIEIDDESDAESFQIDMNAIRRTVRSTRM